MNTAQIVTRRLAAVRLSRLSRLIAIAGCAWLGFSVEYFFSGFNKCGQICLFFSLASACLIPLASRWENHRRHLANVYLGLNLFGLFAMSLVTGQSESYATLFLCGFGVYASHLLGTRAALLWSVICIGCIVVINSEWFFSSVPELRQHSVLDKTLHCIGLTVLIFLLNWQAQHYFVLQTEELIETTHSLSDKAVALEQLARFDTLTGLFNRHSFQRQAEISLDAARATEKRMSLLLLDLDGFKEINDTQGHPIGDAVLQEIANRLKQQVDGEHLVARLGGDEFTFILEGAEELSQVTLICDEIAHSVREPIEIDGKSYSIGVSIGAAVFPDHGDSIEDLFAFADTAMYRAKQSNRDMVIYDPQMTCELVQRRQLEDQLTHALEADEFKIVYQPQIEVSSGRIAGFEALLRWRKDGRWISPVEFIGPLESTDEIFNVGRWVVEEACRQAAVFNQCSDTPVRVSVNVSAAQFRDPEIVQHILSALECSNVAPDLLDLEITESLLIDDVDATAAKLFELRELGVAISVDDFGTGYSSMAYLRDLPLTRLKIDRAFIMGFPQTDDGVIAKSIIALSHNLGLGVIAEGVETDAQLQFLVEQGCDEYQGFLYSRPISAERCELLLCQDPSEHQVSNADATIVPAALDGENSLLI